LGLDNKEKKSAQFFIKCYNNKTMKNHKLIGSTLMVIGTAIGAGMLALPIISANTGFTLSSIIILISGILMLITGFIITEVNLAFPEYHNNFNTMASTLLGPIGKLVSWITSMLLLYAVLAAYIVGNQSLLTNLFHSFNINIPTWINACAFVVILGGFVYWSTKAVDYLNRSLISVKGFLLIAGFVLLCPYVSVTTLSRSISAATTGHALAMIPIFVISFGFHSVIPTIRNYIGTKKSKELKAVMTCGVAITASIYLFWLLVTLGSIPLSGEHSFDSLAKNKGSVGEFVNLISVVIHNKWVISSINGFADIAMTTSFLGIGIGLFDFLAEGFKRKDTRKGRLQTWLLTFIPPLIFALFYPKGFILALGYSAIFASILWIILPALMAYRLRHHATLSSPYRVFGGKFLLITVIIIGIGIITLQILTNLQVIAV
jgi:tyrosine-specific transport protein